MSLPINKNKIQILLLSFACTLIIFFLNKNSEIFSYSLPKLPFNLRNLFELETADKRCKNTEKKFLEQYTTVEISDPALNEYQKDDRYLEALKDIIREKKLGKIKKYLPRIIMYVIFIIVDILLIIFWITLCSCCCCGKKNKESATGCSKCYFFIFCFLNVFAILVCICGFILVPNFLKSINGVICSLYKLVVHFTDGTKKDYSDYFNWKGFEGINDLIIQYNNSKEELLKIKNNECTGTNDFCEYSIRITQELLDENNENNTEFIEELEKSGNNIYLMSESINNIKNKTLDDIENIMKHVDKEGKLGLYLLFCSIALLCLIGLLTLSFYFVCNYNCTICLFHLFWNIEMLIIVITILVGVGFGIFGVLSKDLVPILKYVKSEENLFSENPLLLKFNKYSDNLDYKNLTNKCFNKNESIYTYVFTTNKVYVSKVDDKYFEDFQKEYDKVKNSNTEQISNLVTAYEKLEEIIKNLKNINNDLRSENLDKIFDCNYFKRDFDILLNELKNSLAKKLSLFALGIIVVDLVAFLAIFFGVLIASNYKGKEVEPESQDRHIKMKIKDNRPNLDSSSDNFRK